MAVGLCAPLPRHSVTDLLRRTSRPPTRQRLRTQPQRSLTILPCVPRNPLQTVTPSTSPPAPSTPPLDCTRVWTHPARPSSAPLPAREQTYLPSAPVFPASSRMQADLGPELLSDVRNSAQLLIAQPAQPAGAGSRAVGTAPCASTGPSASVGSFGAANPFPTAGAGGAVDTVGALLDFIDLTLDDSDTEPDAETRDMVEQL
eukprot:64641-Chlamydomonas_euryale.AAC.1